MGSKVILKCITRKLIWKDINMRAKAFIVETDGVTKFVNDIEEVRKGWRHIFKFTLNQEYTGNRFDSIYLGNQQYKRVAKAVKKELNKKYKKVNFYAVIGDNAQIEL